MMMRVAQLIRRASQVQRLIWASLPFHERFAQFLCRVATKTPDAFGTFMYGLFLQNGIQNMPPINGMAAQEWLAKHRDINRLPTQYGANFGNKCFLLVQRKSHDINVTEDILKGFMMRFMRKPAEYLAGKTTLSSAEAYVIGGLYKEAINAYRKNKRQISESKLTRKDDDKGQGYFERLHAPEESGVDERYEKYITDLLDSPSLRAELNRIHPSAHQYIRLTYEGYSDVAIFGDPARGRPSMLDHPYNKHGRPLTPSAWKTNTMPKIEKVLAEALDFRPGLAM